MIFAFGTVGGLTDLGTICLHVASLWPHPPTVVEADPDGGRLAARHDWDLQPGLVELTGRLRSDSERAGAIDEFARRLRNGVKVVVAPPAIEVASSCVSALSQRSKQLEHIVVEDVLVNVGIVRHDSPAHGLIVAASRRIVVIRKEFDDVVALAHRRSLMESMGDWLVLTAGGRLKAADCAAAIDWPIIADLLPGDRKSAARLRTALERLATSRARIRVPQPT